MIMNSDQCMSIESGTLCVWLEEEENNHRKCQKMEDACENIINWIHCEHDGVVEKEGVSIICSWIKISDEEERCINAMNSKKCSYYTTQKGCSRSEESVCSLIRIGDDLNCIVEESAELCELYINADGCKKTIEGDLCLWNSTTEKCSSGFKSCGEYSSYVGCSAIRERCFWNGGISSADGKCFSLEREYSCADLSRSFCNNYLSIEGLIIVDSPCFFNNRNINEEVFDCVSAISMTTCESIKTNNSVVGSEINYCDGAQFLFGIGGRNGIGCCWDDTLSKCMDLLLTSLILPENCSGYETEVECKFHITQSGEKCYWNMSDEISINSSCVDFVEVSDCSSICTNDISGIGKYICDGNVVEMKEVTELCKWQHEEREGEGKNCNCEGDIIPENCSLINKNSSSDCNKINSSKGYCFLNSDDNNVEGVKTCADVVDITECLEILNSVNCIQARKYKFTNIESNTSTPIESFLCIWDYEQQLHELILIHLMSIN
jgi:hypothetical protein